ncbi:MAG: hypothetical protein AB1635_15450 [Acidobacteriota bacterium]
MAKQTKTRRAMLAGMGAMATAGAFSADAVTAQGPAAPAPFTPAFHEEDAWMSAMPGRHRIIIDVTTPQAVPDGIRFAGNLFTGYRTGYGVAEAEVAIIMCLRHGATAHGYTDAIWSKYGKTIDPRAETPPTANPFNSGNRMALSDLAKRGVRFIVCGTASRGLAGRIAGQGGDADAVLREMTANLIPNARLVAAGVVGVANAQARGFSLIYAG